MNASVEKQDTLPADETVPAEPTLLGKKIGGYTVYRRMSQGGMGEIYEALHSTPGKRAVVKVLTALGDGPTMSRAKRRFLDEAKALCTFTHPNLVELYDWGELDNGTIYILMEHIDGTLLKEYQEKHGKIFLEYALEIAQQIVGALKTVHGEGIVHRDLTPYNIIITQDPTTRLGIRVKLLDFGIAKFRAEQETRTQSGDCVGTPRYMAPEQCEAASCVDDRADIYALGVLLFEMLTGESPYVVPIPTAVKWMNAHIGQRPRSLARLLPQASEPLVRLMDAMLDKIPEQRPSASEVYDFLISGIVYRRKFRISKPLVNSILGIILTIASVSAGYRIWSRPANKPQSEQLSTAELANLATRAPSGMVFIPPTQFVMGSSRQEVENLLVECQKLKPTGGCHRDTFEREIDEHVVKLPPYYFSQYEVTNREYADFLNRKTPRVIVVKAKDETPRQVFMNHVNDGRILLADLYGQDGQGSQLLYTGVSFTSRSGSERLPVVQVTHRGAREFCQSHGWDLPTEEQWEYVAQAQESPMRKGIYPWGAFAPPCGAVVLSVAADTGCQLSPRHGPAWVGSHPTDRTVHGVFDMAGNVSEWVRDVFVVPYRPCEDCVTTAGAGDQRAFRGGSFNLYRIAARAQSRSRRGAADVSPDIGFRCAVLTTQGK